MAKITIKKIAHDLKLAVSTVSKALSDSHEIGTDTKQRVLDYANQMNYVRNAYASSLKNSRTGNIAVVIPEVADSFFALAINGIETIAQEKKSHVLIYLTQENQAKEKSIMEDFRNGRVDGILISVAGGNTSYPHIRDLQERNIPIVFFDRVAQGVTSPRVVTDDFESGYKATHHLLEKGCKRIDFLSLSGNLSIIDARLEGYKKAISDRGESASRSHVIVCTNDNVQNENILASLLERKENRPDGIIASVEKLTLITYTVCTRLGISIPDEMKVVGFTSLPSASLLQPSLTTITQPAFEIGQTAAKLLFELLEKKTKQSPNKMVLLPSLLHERGSTQIKT